MRKMNRLGLKTSPQNTKHMMIPPSIQKHCLANNISLIHLAQIDALITPAQACHLATKVAFIEGLNVSLKVAKW